nr:hypothetical protein [Vibrio lentus]PMI90636.1 hypothetical protein BCU35_04015 [Vibrio lentus]
MNIKNELIEFLDKNLKESRNKSRNIAITTYYYGFENASWPTYEETASYFNVGTRERIRQLLNKYFRDYVKVSDLPSLEKVNNLFKSKKFWIISDLEKDLRLNGIVLEQYSIRGILNLLNDVGVECDYEIYTPELEKASRTSLDLYKNTYLINRTEVKAVKALLKKAKGLPGRCGIASLNYINEELGVHYELIKSLIISSSTSWYYVDGNDFWFLYENKESTIINYSEKVFSFISDANSQRLSEAFRNALDGRSHKYPYPPEIIIKEYLETSIYFESNNGSLVFLGQPSKLNDIEIDVLEYLKEKGEVDFPSLRQYLLNKGYGLPHISKATSSSPLVYVDKTRGRTHYKYRLIGNVQSENVKNQSERYQKFLKKLRELFDKGTDETTESIYRREQYYLQKWLFEGKEQECCAICNNKYSVSTLVAAHKKKRSKCNNAERLDPYIVMPVCLIGCDYLYENRYIVVENGIIVKGLDVKNGSFENDVINKILGNKVSEQWLKGRISYFESRA